ncbi:hypothetical protein EVAR_5256_1 [Eumeta japonica]|uniref:Uncharacterized protein n=1 Tax=Eumeta variegata TaxID=151549 RepID=A0A4C1XPN1_EUMVA|nr:hypothetical protein EVAR_5256_1 [Eumeta japonica]
MRVRSGGPVRAGLSPARLTALYSSSHSCALKFQYLRCTRNSFIYIPVFALRTEEEYDRQRDRACSPPAFSVSPTSSNVAEIVPRHYNTIFRKYFDEFR